MPGPAPQDPTASDQLRQDAVAWNATAHRLYHLQLSAADIASELAALARERPSRFIRANIQLYVAQRFLAKPQPDLIRGVAELNLVRRYRVPDLTAMAHLLAARYLRCYGHTSLAAWHLRRVLRGLPASPTAEEAATMLVELHQASGDVRRATYAALTHRRVCRQMVSRFPDSFAAVIGHLGLAESYAAIRDFRTCGRHFIRALVTIAALDPQGDSDTAQQCLVRASRLPVPAGSLAAWATVAEGIASKP